MKLSRSWIIALVVFLLTLIWVVSGGKSEPPSVQTVAASHDAPFKVSVSQVQTRSMTNHLRLKGVTEPQRELQVRAQTYGVVESILVAKGDQVVQGTPIIQLDTQDRRLQLEQAKATLADSKLQMNAVNQMLQKGLAGSAEMARAQSQLAAARSAVLKAELELSYLTITAPFAGMVDERLVEIGQLIDRGDTVVRLIDLHSIKVVAQVSERYVSKIKQHESATITLQDSPPLTARITYVGRNAQSPTRTFPVEMEVDNPQLTLIAGTTATIQIPIEDILAQCIPTSALTLSEHGDIGIKTVNEKSIVEFHNIEYIGEAEDGIWVNGIPEGANVITLGQDFVKAGQRVTAVAHSSSSALGDAAHD